MGRRNGLSDPCPHKVTSEPNLSWRLRHRAIPEVCSRARAGFLLLLVLACLAPFARAQAQTLACPSASAGTAGSAVAQRVDLGAGVCDTSFSLPSDGILSSLETFAARDDIYRITLRIRPADVTTAGFTCAGVTPVQISSSRGSFYLLAYDMPLNGDAHRCTARYTRGTVEIAIPVESLVAGAGQSKSATLQATSFEPSAGTADTTAPRVLSLERHDPVDALVSSGPLTWQIGFDEDVRNLDAGDFSLSGSSAGLSVSAISDRIYRVTAAGGDLDAVNGPVALQFVPTQDIADAAGNPLADLTPTGANEPGYMLDTTRPGVTILSDAGDASALAAIPLEIRFTEPVTGFEAGDLVVSGGTIANLTGSADRYAANLLPAGDGVLRVTLPAGRATDAASLGNLPAPEFSVISDRTAPGVTLASPVSDPSNAARIPVTVSLSEPGFAELTGGDISVTGAMLEGFQGAGTSYGFDLVPLADGPIRAEIAAGAVRDAAGNGNASAAVQITSDRRAPRLASIIRATPAEAQTNADRLTWRVVFDEDIANLDAADFVAEGTTAAVSVTPLDARRYDITLSGGDLATLDGPVSLRLSAASDITDLPGTPIVDLAPIGADEGYLIDNTGPVLTLSGLPGEITDAFTATIDFDEPVTGFDIGDITAVNATLSAFSGAGARYEFRVTAGPGGDVRLSVAGGVALDAAGNPSAALSEVSLPVDRTPPTVTIAGMPEYLRGPVTLTFTFSEPVSGFTREDITASPALTLGAVSALSGSVYSATATPVGAGLVSVSVDGDAVRDGTGNGNFSSDPATGTIDMTAPRLISVDRLGPALTNADSLTWSLTFSEDMIGVAGAVIGLTGTTALRTATQQVQPQVYHLTFSGGDLADLPDGTVALDLTDLGAITDVAGNPLDPARPSGSYEVRIDNTAPSQIEARYLSPAEPVTSADVLTWEIVFDEDVTGLGAADFTVSGTTAAISSVDPVRPDLARVRVSGGDLAGLTGTVTLGFAAGADIRDGAGNAMPVGTLRHLGAAPGGAAWRVDNTAPVIVASSPTTSPFATGEMLVHLAFSKPMVFDPGTAPALQIANGSLRDISYPDVQSAVIRIAPGGPGQVEVRVPAGAFRDEIGLGNAGPVSLSRRFDPETPRLAGITRVFPTTHPSNADRLSWQLVFSEPVSGVDAADFVLSGSTAGLAVTALGESLYRIEASGGDLATLTGRVTLDFAPGRRIVDAAGNSLLLGGMADHLPAPDNWADLDHSPPVIGLGSTTPEPFATGDLRVVMQSDEPLTGFDASVLDLSNGTVTGQSRTDALTQEITITPAAPGPVTVTLPEGAFRDQAGNPSAARSLSRVYAPDLSGPRIEAIVRLTPPSLPGNADQLRWRVTFDEDVTGVDAGDLSFQGATPTTVDVLRVSARIYEVDISGGDIPDLTGAVTLGFAASRDIADLAGNPLGELAVRGADEREIVLDNTRPGVEIDSTAPEPTNEASIPVAIRFDEPVGGFDIGDLEVSGATLSGFSGSGALYGVTLAPTGDGPIRLEIGAGAALDAAGNLSFAAAGFSRRSDRTAPNGTITGLPPTLTGPAVVDIAFSEPVTGFDAGDIALSNARLSGFAGSGASYSATVTPDADGPVAIVLPAGAAVDGAGNGSLASAEMRAVADLSGPGAVLTGLPDLITGPVTVQIRFDEQVTGFDLAGLAVSNAELSALEGGASSYSVTLTPQGDGPVKLRVRAAAAVDAAGHANRPSADLSAMADVSRPVVVIGGAGPVVAGPFTATFGFSEPVNGFEPADIAATNADISDFAGAGASYTVRITPRSEGPVVIGLAADAALDAAGNGTDAASLNTYADLNAPVVTIDGLPDPITGAARATIRFSEPVLGFTLADLSTDNAQLSGFSGSDDRYEVTVTPDADGPVRLAVAAGGGVDLAGLGNGAVSVELLADLTAPGVTLSATPAAPGTPYSLAVTFSEPVTGLTLGDFQTSGADLAGLAGSGAAYSVQVTARMTDHSVFLPAGAAMDAAGHASLASPLFQMRPDGTRPVLQITGLPDPLRRGQPVPLIFTFSEEVYGFEPADIVLDHAVASQFSGGPRVFSVMITPDGQGAVSLSVADGAARDGSGEPSMPMALSVEVVEGPDPREDIAAFLAARSRDLIANQPGLTGFLTGREGGRMAASLTRGHADFALRTAGRGPVWMSLQGARSEDDAGRGTTYALAVFGSHWDLGETAILGAMLQFDQAEMTTAGGMSLSGTGWLIGPYFAAQVRSQPLYVEGRLLYGRTRNEIRPVGGGADRFDGERWLAMLGITGAYHGARVSTLPSLTFSHVRDTQETYRDGFGARIPRQEVRLSELALGVDFEMPVAWDAGDLTINWGMSGIWSRAEGQGAAQAFVREGETARGRIDLGYAFDNGHGLTSRARAYLDGIGSADGRFSIGIEAGFELEF